MKVRKTTKASLNQPLCRTPCKCPKKDPLRKSLLISTHNTRRKARARINNVPTKNGQPDWSSTAMTFKIRSRSYAGIEMDRPTPSKRASLTDMPTKMAPFTQLTSMSHFPRSLERHLPTKISIEMNSSFWIANTSVLRPILRRAITRSLTCTA